jgi:hypothetical protein
MCAAKGHVRFTPESDAECVHFECQNTASGSFCASSSVACRIKTAFNTSRHHGVELRVRHTLHNCNWGRDGLGLLRYQRCNCAHKRHWVGPGRGCVNLFGRPLGLADCPGIQGSTPIRPNKRVIHVSEHDSKQFTIRHLVELVVANIIACAGIEGKIARFKVVADGF